MNVQTYLRARANYSPPGHSRPRDTMSLTEIGGSIAGGILTAAAGETFVRSTTGLPYVGGIVGFIGGATALGTLAGTERGQAFINDVLPHSLQALGLGTLTLMGASLLTHNTGALVAAGLGGVAAYGATLYGMDRAGII